MLYLIFRKACSFFVRLTFLPEKFFEHLRGLDFANSVPAYEKGHHEYAPSRWPTRRLLKKYLKGKITKDDAMIDIGCGKGRMVYFFSKFPFKKVAGLEYSSQVVEIARRNMQILHMGGGAIIIEGDASTYQDYDEYTYFYLFNPFDENIMRPFLQNLKANLAKKPRAVRIIYLNPTLHDLFISEGLKLEQELKLITYPFRCNIYTL